MTVLDRLRESWLEGSTRERTLFGFGALVAIGALGYAFAWQPLTRELDSSEASVRAAQARSVWAQQTVDEIAGLYRSASTLPPADARAAVQRVVGARGLHGAMATLEAQDGRVRVTFAAIEFDALTALLDALGREEQLFVVEALLAARVEPGVVRAELALARPTAR